LTGTLLISEAVNRLYLHNGKVKILRTDQDDKKESDDSLNQLFLLFTKPQNPVFIVLSEAKNPQESDENLLRIHTDKLEQQSNVRRSYEQS